jgi:hypothetical protein
MTVLQPYGDAIGNQILHSGDWRPALDFPGGSTWPVDPRYILPPKTPICWSPNGVTWTKPTPGGPILRAPDGSYVTPSPQLPTGDRGPATNGGGIVLPARPGSTPLPVNGQPELTTTTPQEAAMAMTAGDGFAWGPVLVGAGLAFLVWRSWSRGRKR